MEDGFPNWSDLFLYTCGMLITQEGTQFRQKRRYLLETLLMSGWFPTGIYRSMSPGIADKRRERKTEEKQIRQENFVERKTEGK